MNADKKRRRAASIQVDADAQELVIEWQDGHVSRFSLPELRRTCPCANCKEQREKAALQRGELVMLEGEAAAATSRVRDVQRVGRYGIRIVWADGHDYGIYTFEALRAREEG